MGEYNDTILAHREWKRQLNFFIGLCRDVSCLTLERLKSISGKEKKEVKKLFNVGREAYTNELNKLRITGKGEIYYNNELYHSNDAIASMIKQHLEILEHILEEIFHKSESIMVVHRGYVEFLSDFVKYKEKH